MKWNNVAGALALSLMLGCAIAGSGSEYATHVRECVTLKDGMPVLDGPIVKVRYGFQVNARQRVESLELMESSGVADFDEAVGKGIQQCDPFPLPPLWPVEARLSSEDGHHLRQPHLRWEVR